MGCWELDIKCSCKVHKVRSLIKLWVVGWNSARVEKHS